MADRSGSEKGGLTRKQLLGSGATAASALLLSQGAGVERALAAAKGKRKDVAGMNIVLFLTDQERAIQHFPPNWLRQNLPGMRRLRRHGLSFERAFTNACMCSPARSTLMSGYFPAQHGVKYTLEEEMPASEYPQVNLPTELKNLATVMKAAGYTTIYKGKWHCSKPADEERRGPGRPRKVRLPALGPAGRRRQPDRARGRRRQGQQRRPLHGIGRHRSRRGRDAVPELDRGPAAAVLHGDLAGQPARRPLLPGLGLRRRRIRRSPGWKATSACRRRSPKTSKPSPRSRRNSSASST